MSLWFERSRQPGWGLFGGRDGAPTDVVVERGNGPERVLKVNAMPLRRGATIRVSTGGGGGYGDPATRDAGLIAADLADGYVTPEHADHQVGPAHTDPAVAASAAPVH